LTVAADREREVRYGVISKGNTQSEAIANDHFDEVAFEGMRPRLLEVLQTVGFLPEETFPKFNENRFRKSEPDFAFASVVRCSLTGRDRSKRTHRPTVEMSFPLLSPDRQLTASCQHALRSTSVVCHPRAQ
jgi:hypothetical protein